MSTNTIKMENYKNTLVNKINKLMHESKVTKTWFWMCVAEMNWSRCYRIKA